MPSTPSHQSSSIAVGLVKKNKAARQKIKKGKSRAVIGKAFREKYACGTISPKNVITTVEKTNAPRPARTEPDRSVRDTSAPTPPQITVASTRLEFFRRSRTRAASLFPPSTSICRRNGLRLKIARFRPENSADRVMQAIMPSQIQMLGM